MTTYTARNCAARPAVSSRRHVERSAASSRGVHEVRQPPAPAWRRPEHGGQFWINGIGQWNLPSDAYFAVPVAAHLHRALARSGRRAHGTSTRIGRGHEAAESVACGHRRRYRPSPPDRDQWHQAPAQRPAAASKRLLTAHHDGIATGNPASRNVSWMIGDCCRATPANNAGSCVSGRTQLRAGGRELQNIHIRRGDDSTFGIVASFCLIRRIASR